MIGVGGGPGVLTANVMQLSYHCSPIFQFQACIKIFNLSNVVDATVDVQRLGSVQP